MAKLRYVEQTTLSPPVDGYTISNQSRRSNSIYDPRMANHYEVLLSAKIRVTYTYSDTDRGSMSAQIVGIRSGGDMGVSTPISEGIMCEDHPARCREVGAESHL